MEKPVEIAIKLCQKNKGWYAFRHFKSGADNGLECRNRRHGEYFFKEHRYLPEHGVAHCQWVYPVPLLAEAPEPEYFRSRRELIEALAKTGGFDIADLIKKPEKASPEDTG